MINRLFAVQDMKAGAFHAPFPSSTEATAVRLMQDWVHRADHPYNLHPEDYTLYEIGSFDDLNGAVIPSDPRSVCNLSQLV